MPKLFAGWIVVAGALALGGCATAGSGSSTSEGVTRSFGSSGDDDGSTSTPESSGSGDDATTADPSGDDATAPSGDGSAANPFNLPNFNLPMSNPTPADDGGSCAARICFDFFDCLAFGCSTACTNLHCM
jgi:hypothetical protein